MEILGLLLSDGNISKKKDSIGFYNKDKLLIDRFKYLMEKVFEIDNFKKKNDESCPGVIIYSKLLVEYLKLIGFTNENKENIPSYFYTLPKDEIRTFIKGYLDGDGTVSILKIKGMEYPTPILYSVKRDFLNQLQSLMLLKLGIQTKLREHNTKKGLIYGLVVRGNEGRIKFLEIGATSKHKLKRLNEIKKVTRVKEHENIPHPSILINAIRKKLFYKEFRNKDYYIYKTGKATKHSLNILYDLASKKGILTNDIKKEFELLSRDDIGWERIEDITFDGKKDLYDFTVDKDSFTASPYFLLHNSKFYGESEKKVRQIFEDAEKSAPSIIFIDEIDAIAPKREDSRGEVERRVVAQLLTMMSGLKDRKNVIVIGATNRPNSIDPALRRPGRFDREISIRVPDKKGRLEILKIHTRNMPLTEDVKLDKIAEVTHGFVGADLSALAKEAAMSVLRKILPELNLQQKTKIPDEVLEKLRVTDDDFKTALKIVRPSAIREVLVESPNVKWLDIGGLEELKEELKEAVEWPLKHAEAFKRMGIRPARGILMYGPPGTGKTLLAKAVASEAEANFIQVKGPSLINMFVGESERGIRQIFEKARQVSPCIIFFDEIDSIASRRGSEIGTKVTERMVNTMLAEMDGLQELNDVVVIAATNRPDMIDPALLRPGRFDRIINTTIPDKKSRLEILKIHTKGMPLTKEVKLEKLAELTENYVGADIEAVCREAAMLALRESIKAKDITMKHFEQALTRIKPSIFEEDLKRYQEIEEEYIRKAKAGQLKKEKQVYFG